MPRLTAARRASRRAEILFAAEACFSRLGFHRTTMRDVIAEAGLSVGCVYKHFNSKDEIIAAISAERHAAEAAALARTEEAADPVEAVRALGREFIGALATAEGMTARSVGVQTWAEALLNETVLAHVIEGIEGPVACLARSIARAQNSGRLTRRASPEALARSFVALFHGVVLQKLWQPGLDPAPYFEAIDALLDGLIITETPDRQRR